ncbi:MAG: hypothetical protein D3926_12340 [Desulfobacteraceae bacterium]|nr:MAG: hypothetical protein D3926_12340 [Desulfobacteraceae bacterium]
MKQSSCTPQRLSKFAMGALLVAAALALTVISVTFLPVIGFALVIPVGILAFYVFKIKLNDQCELDLS